MATAMHNMKANGDLDGKFATTMDFVNVLKKYIKIDKICESNEIENCWPTKQVTARSGDVYDVKKAKTRKDIMGSEINGKDNANVGIVLSDGAHLILTYDPDDEGLEMGSETAYNSVLLPVGDGVEEYKNYSNNAMKGLAFIMDVNGSKGPNKEKIQELTITDEKTGIKTETYKDVLDIRSFNGAHFIAEGDPLDDPCARLEILNSNRKIALNGVCYWADGGRNWYATNHIKTNGQPGDPGSGGCSSITFLK